MKKLKIIVAAILRGVILIAPAAASGWWFWGKAPALIAILAAIGVEFLWLLVFSFVAVARSEAKRRMKEASESEDNN